jgi:hypothetical protein
MAVRRVKSKEPVVAPDEVEAPSLASIGAVGILEPGEIADLTAGGRRVALLMGDGEWHTAQAIRVAAGRGGVEASEGLRRMRELRRIPGVEVERRRSSESRMFEYRATRES